MRSRFQARAGEESGNVTVFVLGIATTMLLCAGLVFDGGAALNARMKVADDVEQAARAGAQEIDVAHLRLHGEVTLDHGRARNRATGHISSFGYTDVTVDVVGDEISVSAKDSVKTTFLSLIGIQKYDVAASATSQAVTR